MNKKALLSVLLLLALTVPARAQAPQGKSLAIFISGLSGSRQFQVYFKDASDKLAPVLRDNGYPEIYRFSETPGGGSSEFRADRDTLQKTLSEIAARGPYENVFVWVAGHGNGRDDETELHLPGQDVSYKELMGWLDQVPAKAGIFALAVPQGQAWIKTLARPGRVIAAGGGLREYDFIPWMFLRHFPSSFFSTAKSAGEVSAPRRTNLRDVFVEAQKKSQAWYRDNHLQPTELALLDADGDGKAESLFDPSQLPEPSAPSLEEAVSGPVPPERENLKIKAVDLSSFGSSAPKALSAAGDGTVLAPAVIESEPYPGAGEASEEREELPDSREAGKISFLISQGGEGHEF